MAVFVVIKTHCLPSCSSGLSIIHLVDLTHLTHCQVESLQSKLPVEESMYWFVKTWLVHHLWRRSSTSTCQELHASTTSLILDFGCIFFLFLFSLVLSSLSKCNDIAFTLHLRGGVKGKIVISYSRVSLPLLSLMYSIYTPLGLNPNHPFPLYSFITFASDDSRLIGGNKR